MGRMIQNCGHFRCGGSSRPRMSLVGGFAGIDVEVSFRGVRLIVRPLGGEGRGFEEPLEHVESGVAETQAGCAEVAVFDDDEGGPTAPEILGDIGAQFRGQPGDTGWREMLASRRSTG